MGDPAERTSRQSEADECGHRSRNHRMSDGVDEPTGWRFGETQHGVWRRYQLGRIMGRENGITQRKMLEGVETIRQKGERKHLQPDGTVAVDDIIVSK